MVDMHHRYLSPSFRPYRRVGDKAKESKINKEVQRRSHSNNESSDTSSSTKCDILGGKGVSSAGKGLLLQPPTCRPRGPLTLRLSQKTFCLTSRAGIREKMLIGHVLLQASTETNPIVSWNPLLRWSGGYSNKQKIRHVWGY